MYFEVFKYDFKLSVLYHIQTAPTLFLFLDPRRIQVKYIYTDVNPIKIH